MESIIQINYELEFEPLFRSVQDFIGTLEKNLLNLKVSSKTEKEFLNL